jgi:hypothetical protein
MTDIIRWRNPQLRLDQITAPLFAETRCPGPSQFFHVKQSEQETLFTSLDTLDRLTFEQRILADFYQAGTCAFRALGVLVALTATRCESKRWLGCSSIPTPRPTRYPATLAEPTGTALRPCSRTPPGSARRRIAADSAPQPSGTAMARIGSYPVEIGSRSSNSACLQPPSEA